jgi:hypothetical protein
MEPFSNSTPPSAPPHRAAAMTEPFPSQRPDQVPALDSSGDLPDPSPDGLPGQSASATPAQPSKGRRSGTPRWIGLLIVLGGLAVGLSQGGSQRLYYLLGVSLGAVLISIMVIVLIVRRSRSQRAANMNYGHAPSGGQENLAPPGYGPGYAPPGDGRPGYAPPGRPPTYRVWLIASTVLGAIGLVGIIVFAVLIGHTSSSQPDYNSPSVVAASIKTQVQQRLSDKSGQYYEPGVTVTSVVCTPSGNSTDHCVITLSNGVTGTATAVILGNGTGFRTQ